MCVRVCVLASAEDIIVVDHMWIIGKNREKGGKENSALTATITLQ